MMTYTKFIKKFSLALFGTLFSISAMSQDNQEQGPSALTVGQQVPDLHLGKVLRYKDNTARLSDFGDKAVILDFFATWCTPCVAEFPRLDSLQREFNDQIQIILVTYEDQEKIEQFLKTNRIASSVDLPVIVEDRYLSKVFPHRVISHDVWIKNGTVKAITSPLYITAANINKLISGEDLNLPIKREDINFTTDKPLFDKGNGGDPRNVLYRSTLTTYIDELKAGGQGISLDSSGRITRMFSVGGDIYGLCRFALEEKAKMYYHDNQIRILTNNPQSIRLGDQDYESWKWDNTYIYELQTPPLSREAISKLMLDDIRRYFNVVPSVEKELLDSYVLTCDTLKAKKAISKGGDPDNNFSEKDGKGKYMLNTDIPSLVYRLNSLSPIPVLDESGFKHKVDIYGLPADLSDIDTVNKSLAKYGFSLIPAKREVELFYIRDADN